MNVIYVLSISVLFQITAAFLAFRLIRVTGRRIAWIFIASAISLMAFRRGISLFQVLSRELTQPLDLPAELVALATSVLMVAGIALIEPIFLTIKRSEEEVRKINRALKVLIMSNHTVIRATEESALLKDVCQIIVEAGGYLLAWVGFAEQDEEKKVRPVVYAGHEEGYLETVNITWSDTEKGSGPTGKAIRTGKPCTTKNILTDPDYAPWRDEAIKRGYSSSIALPLIANGQTFGALTIYAQNPDAFDTEEIKLMTELADDLAFGIITLRIRADHKRIDESLRESEEKFRAMSASAKDAIIMIDNEGNISYWNEAAEKMFGYSEQEALGKELHTFLSSQRYHEAYRNGFSKFKTNGQGVAVGKTLELEAMRKDGTEFPIELSVSAVKLKGKWNATGIVRDITERKLAEEALQKNEEELKKRVKELEEFYDMAVGRELRIKDLREENEELKEELEKYKKP
ncbi:MAG: PAS domain S-box protein [Thermodesulfovibrionales bacterium]